MITVGLDANDDVILSYAKSELIRILSFMTEEPVTDEFAEDAVSSDWKAGKHIRLAVDPELAQPEIAILGDKRSAIINGGSPAAVLHAVYTWLEQLGCVFEFSGEILPSKRPEMKLPAICMRHTPSIRERGIRMHLNFVQDQSFFSEEEFIGFVDRMAAQKWNYLCFHMYTPQQWFPFSYRGIKHLDLKLGNLERKPISQDMIGREKVKVREHWFPREFEHIRDPEELLQAMYERYKTVMQRAHDRGIRNSVSFEPESIPPGILEQLSRQDAGELLATAADQTLVNEWQQGWSGTALAEMDVRHPLVLDIAVERCLQCIDAFPHLDELQLISREGTAWHPKAGQSYEQEMERLSAKFGLPAGAFDRTALATVVPPDKGSEINPRAHPYWTVMPGSDYYPTVIGALRFVEFAMDILSDPRVTRKLEERGVAHSIAVYNPNPESVRLMMPAIASMLPEGTRFHCIADYGARDIADNLPAWTPLVQEGHRPGVISWLEFDGTMMLAQGWMASIADNIRAAAELGAETVYFNHWRVRSLEHNAAAAAAICWDSGQGFAEFGRRYFGNLYGVENVERAEEAYRLLEEATIYAKNKNYNIGFTNDWVIRKSTDEPGYYWGVLAKSVRNFEEAAKAFETLAASTLEPAGLNQARYMHDLSAISALHIQAVHHLQNAKLPLFGYRAWPLGNEHASCPPPALLEGIVREAELALALEKRFMSVYAQWVNSCDEQGQLVMQHQGIIETLERIVAELRRRLEHEKRVESELNQKRLANQ